MDEREMGFWIDQHDAVELGQQVAQFCLVGLEKLTSHRDVEKEVADLDVGSYGAATHLLTDDIRAVYLQ